MFFKAFFALSFKSFELSYIMNTAKSLDGTSASAKCFAWSGECLPIYPKLQAAAAFKWSSGSLISASFNGAIPFDTITAMANASSKAEMYPRVIIPGSRAFPFDSLM